MAEERRIITVLFADVAGSTALGEALDPEDVRVLLRRYYDVAREIVIEHGGILEKFIGDAVVAVFGFPHTHDDDPQRALAAALTLRDRVRADPGLGDRLPIRLGINTGEVVAARESATGDFPLSGDAVNVAARLQQAAESWGILCGERTVGSVRGGFDFGPLMTVEVRGKVQPIRALALLGRAAVLPVAARTPLIGRAPDLQQLELVAGRAFHELRPFLVSVIAPAGVGKTRLLEEFLERLPSVEPRAIVAIAQCLPYGQRLTYWPLRGVLYRLIGVSDDAMPSIVRGAIRTWLEGSGLEALDREVELLAATVGAGEAEATDRSSLLAAWRTFFEIAARRAPLVLVFEDLHWSSDSLLDLFEFVMQPRGDLPLLMIALTRPELLDRRPGWGGGRRNYVSISLEPLSDRDTAALIDQLLEGCSPDLVDRIVRRAEGNPFFAGELIRSVAERGGTDQLPDTVQATVLARLDQLAPDERRIIQLGSVFGRAFRSPGLLALEPDLERVDEIIERLLDKDLLRATGSDIFAFRHILIREVAYQTLTRAERGRLHAAAAQWLEALAGEREDSLAELIAFHYREAAGIASAQRPNDPQTLEVRKKAVEWLSRATEVAAAATATIEGSRHLRGAIEFAEARRLPDLYQRLGEIAESSDTAIPAYQTALRLSREQGRPPEQELQVMTGLLTIYTRSQGSVADRPSLDAMRDFRQEAAKLAARVTDERLLARYMAADAFYPFWILGSSTTPPSDAELADADAKAEKALGIARGLDDPNLESMALDALSGTAQMRGDWWQGREYARRRLSFQDRLNMVEKVDAHSMVAWSSALLGDLEEADRVTAQGLAQVQPGQVPAWALHIVVWRIYALTLLGHWDEALLMGERARQLWLESGKPSAGYAVRGFMALIDVAHARQDDRLAESYREILDTILMAFPADSFFRRWLGYGGPDLRPIEAAVDDMARTAAGLPERAERGLNLLLDAGKPLAADRLGELLRRAEAGHFRPLEAQARRGLGIVGRDHEMLTSALAIWEDMKAVPYAARVRCERALLTGDHAELEKGLAVLERLGDRLQLGRYERRQVG
jgi:class 3 adenylate cyclase